MLGRWHLRSAATVIQRDLQGGHGRVHRLLRRRELERILQRVVWHMCRDDRRQRRWDLRVHPAIGRRPSIRVQVHLGRLDVPGGVCGRHVVHVHHRRLHEPHLGSGWRRGAVRRVLERVRRVQRRARARLHRRVRVQLRPQCHRRRRQLCVWRGSRLGVHSGRCTVLRRSWCVVLGRCDHGAVGRRVDHGGRGRRRRNVAGWRLRAGGDGPPRVHQRDAIHGGGARRP